MMRPVTSSPRLRRGRLAGLVAAAAVTAVSVAGAWGPGPSAGDLPYDGAPVTLTAHAPPDPGGAGVAPAPEPEPSSEPVVPVLPPGSGEGRRVVLDLSDQRVWLVAEDGALVRSHLVSGSLYDNLQPGTYAVWSRSVRATGIDGSALRWMVRFAHGERAAIGFHDIPVLDGEKVQSRAELGTPLSHGCIRQAGPDAQALWRFAPVGTTVVVTA